MPRLSLWWALLLLFALTIGGIQSLGLWTRPRSAPTPTSAVSGGGVSTTAAARHQNAEARHWRALFMQQ